MIPLKESLDLEDNDCERIRQNAREMWESEKQKRRKERSKKYKSQNDL
jgi:hypothetical protein